MVEFFIHFFELVGVEFLDVVEDIRKKRKLLVDLNTTYITSIPKKDKPNSFNEYHPISLCNLVYKVVTSIISNKIKPMLENFISKE